MELQKKKSGTYETIKTWSASKTGTYLSVAEKRTINLLSDYRLKTTLPPERKPGLLTRTHLKLKENDYENFKTINHSFFMHIICNRQLFNCICCG